MPRPRISFETAAWSAGILCCCTLGPATLHLALAASAGTLFEAAPFVLAAEVLPPRLRALTVAAGCGCGRRTPGALSLPATALCWVAFGPAIALGRLAAAFALMGWGRRPGLVRSGTRRDETGHRPDALSELLALAPCAAGAALASTALGRLPPHIQEFTSMRVALFAAGAALGIAAPCATAAVAMAAALAATVPVAAAGILVTGGLVTIPSATAAIRPGALLAALRHPRPRPLERAQKRPRRAVWSSLVLAIALALLAVRGAAGFVNPKLLPAAAAGSVLAVLRAQRPTRSAVTALVPAMLLVALVTGSPQTADSSAATHLEDAYAGEKLTFVGRSRRSGAATVLERSFITCCRADAATLALRLSSRLPIDNGTWVFASGVLVRSPQGLLLRLVRWRAVAAPTDPFLYR